MTDYAPTIILVISPRLAWDSSASSPGKRPKQRTGWKSCFARDCLLASLVHPGIIFCTTSNPTSTRPFSARPMRFRESRRDRPLNSSEQA
ncbi:uncharacterized protein K444DRAFT_226973 [Hyaloscypha bicolor E]|uniref:Uncharacterized protein n=1 Tax=Hyaloscypha bicolor E TaxID=1095630 RepID=A0A2J6SK89_9HELO|nr:uncharacterized protein K444DRAFT_226973 [Hyaloscypha bicolor E]PMD51198.1 hypothetical protein K444DRAFT_226973 [Hyaloscypha bicolor E]